MVGQYIDISHSSFEILGRSIEISEGESRPRLAAEALPSWTGVPEKWEFRVRDPYNTSSRKGGAKS